MVNAFRFLYLHFILSLPLSSISTLKLLRIICFLSSSFYFIFTTKRCCRCSELHVRAACSSDVSCSSHSFLLHFNCFAFLSNPFYVYQFSLYVCLWACAFSHISFIRYVSSSVAVHSNVCTLSLCVCLRCVWHRTHKQRFPQPFTFLPSRRCLLFSSACLSVIVIFQLFLRFILLFYAFPFVYSPDLTSNIHT